jgi:hypothetical protein
MRKLTEKEIQKTRNRIVKYVRSNVKRGHHPGYLEIKAKFNIGIENYFKDMPDLYECSDIRYDRRSYYKERQDEKSAIIREKILKFVKNQVVKGKYPTRNEIEDTFNIGILYYFGNLRNLYKKAGIEFKPHFGPKNDIEKIKMKRQIIKYIRNKIINEEYLPNVLEIKKVFKVGPETYFPQGIKQIIKEAGFDKKLFRAFTCLEKERKLIEIATCILEDFGYHIISNKNKIGPDIIAEINGNLIPVEIKAFNKSSVFPFFYGIDKNTTRDPARQIINYVKEMKASSGIIITTAHRIDPSFRARIPSNIVILVYDDIERFVNNYKKRNFRNYLNFVANPSIEANRDEKIQKVRGRVTGYIKKEAKKGHYPTVKEIQRRFGINILVYFKNIFEAYEEASVSYPAHKGRMGGRRLTESEKAEMRKKIVNFVKMCVKQGKPVNFDIIQKEMKVAICSYFDSTYDIYEKAGMANENRHS